DAEIHVDMLVGMNWKAFHHPDIALPVVRRKAGEELLTLLKGIGSMVLSAGASEIYGHCYPNRRAFKASVKRLQKNGLLVEPHTDGSMPTLQLSERGAAHLPAYYNPTRYWSKPWNKWWYILMFDVPEKDRAYRDTLRNFLKTQRFGCLQRSVWVTPRDVRPEYDDLDRAAGIDSVAFLFEAKTVLGYGNHSVISEAWNFDRINQIQQLYLDVAEENLSLFQQYGAPDSEVAQLLRMENLAYTQAMMLDPLLPKELHPDQYAGPRVFEIRQKLFSAILKQINPL
ncbi:PaaX family transcriptional regulator C-terminal domain-containing protein, partial [Pontiellaceae bacterium B12219]|nr:PaaX family transcriptional regulator C-terminal domain-containing protein [Pontiellaceae bacterium B12219]